MLPNSSNTVWISFSGDGEYLGYTRESTQNIVELWASRIGDATGLLISPEWFSKMGKHPDKPVIPMDLHWIPGTHDIGFHTNLAADYRGFCYTPDNLWWVDAENGTANPKPVDGEIFYSPDGKQAAVVNQKHMFLMNADGTGQRIVDLENYHTLQMDPTYAQPPRVHWAGDSQSVFVIIPEANSFSDHNPEVAIWKVAVADAKAIRFAKYDRGGIVFSPDHRWSAYVKAAAGGSDRNELILSAADGSRSVSYLQGDLLRSISWSPDSIHFIFWMNSVPYLGSVCGAHVALMESAPLDPFTNQPAVGTSNEWIDSERFILKAGTMLFQGDITDSGVNGRLLSDFLIVDYTWRIVPL